MPKTNKPIQKKTSPPKSSPPSKKKVVAKKVAPKPVAAKPVAAKPVVVAPVAIVAPVVAKPTAATATDSAFNDIQAELTKLADAGVQIPALKRLTIALKKAVDKERKEAAKARPKPKRASNPNKAPSGFAKPAPISAALAKFLGEKPDTLVARTAVTRAITQYVKEKNLQNQSNKRHILPDATLKKLLGVTDKDEVTYFNLQKHLKQHYPASKASTTVAA